MLIENVLVCGFEPALRGMRNPAQSWDRADSIFDYEVGATRAWVEQGRSFRVPEFPNIGDNDMERLLALVKAGSEHRKCIRQIMVWFDIEVPIYIWSELDTYHGDPDSWEMSTQPVRDSCSTMHTLGKRDVMVLDFEDGTDQYTLDKLNGIGAQYRKALAEKDSDVAKCLLRQMKQALPGNYLQKATYSMNYETALTMWHQRRNHRLPEWSGRGGICEFINALPWMDRIIQATLKG